MVSQVIHVFWKRLLYHIILCGNTKWSKWFIFASSKTDCFKWCTNLSKAQYKLLMVRFLVEVPEAFIHRVYLRLSFNQETYRFLYAFDHEIHRNSEENSHIYPKIKRYSCHQLSRIKSLSFLIKIYEEWPLPTNSTLFRQGTKYWSTDMLSVRLRGLEKDSVSNETLTARPLHPPLPKYTLTINLLYHHWRIKS